MEANRRKQCHWKLYLGNLYCKLLLLLLLVLLLLSMPQLRSTYGPQSPSNMWSLPQDVTIVTDPLGLEEGFLLRGAGREGSGRARLWWMEAVIPSTSLTSCMALQGYGDDLEGRTNEVSLDDVFLYTLSQETPQLLTIRNIYYFYLWARDACLSARLPANSRRAAVENYSHCEFRLWCIKPET